MGKRSSSRSSTAADVAELRVAVEHLADHVQCLTQAIDELADQLQWRSRQTRGDDVHAGPVVLTSMPVDPTAEDWQINRYCAEDLPAALASTKAPSPQQTLFE